MLALLEPAIADHAFPGAALIAGRSNAIAREWYCGRFTYDDDGRSVDAETSYDLASLTKVIATLPMAMLLFERGTLDLDQPFVEVIPEALHHDSRRTHITFRHLLTHTSGYPAHRKYYEKAKDKSELLDAVFATSLECDPGSRTEYSDLGFILLGVALERLAENLLDDFFYREIAAPLDLDCRFGPFEHVGHIPPTLEAVDFRTRRICGTVNDENAWVMGGVAAHAGLFGTAHDVARFAQWMLRRGTPLLKPETIDLFTRKQPGTSRTLGWDTPTPPSQAGEHFSLSSYGHLGYTGTSLWIDPERDIFVTLLSNRTYPDNRSHEIKRVRPLIHDAVMKTFL